MFDVALRRSRLLRHIYTHLDLALQLCEYRVEGGVMLCGDEDGEEIERDGGTNFGGSGGWETSGGGEGELGRAEINDDHSC